MSCTGSTRSTGTFNCDLVAVCWHAWACVRRVSAFVPVQMCVRTCVCTHARVCVCVCEDMCLTGGNGREMAYRLRLQQRVSPLQMLSC